MILVKVHILIIDHLDGGMEQLGTVNGLDVCHGGLVFALGDTAFAFACNAHNIQSFAASCQIDFLRPARLSDTLTAVAREEHRGRRSGYYTIQIHNQNEELVAIFRGRSGSNGQPIIQE